MFIHLGGDLIIRSTNLIAIFDLSIEESSKISRNFIDFAVKHGKIEKIGEEESKSLVITEQKIFYSPISSTTLKKRADVLSDYQFFHAINGHEEAKE